MWFGVGAGMLLSWVRGLAFGVVIASVILGSILTFVWPPLESALPLPDSGFGTLTFTRGVASHPVGPPLFWLVVGWGCIALSGRLFRGARKICAARDCLGSSQQPLRPRGSALAGPLQAAPRTGPP